MRRKSSTVEGELATRQHGVVTRSALLGAGVSPSGIDRRVQKGALIPVHRGVYRVGHRAPSTEARYLAAVLACGEGAALSGLAAAHLHRLVKGRPPAPEVTAPTWRRVKGVRTRRSRNGRATVVRGIPVTTVPQTIVDLAAALAPDALARVCHEAGVLYGTTPRHVEAVLRPSTPGAKLRAVMSGETKVTLSTLEQAFIAVLRENDLPLPRTNKSVEGRRLDCRWPEKGITVELDSYRYHRSRHAWESDRRREREAYARGDAFRRYTYEDVLTDPRAMLGELRGLLA